MTTLQIESTPNTSMDARRFPLGASTCRPTIVVCRHRLFAYDTLAVLVACLDTRIPSYDFIENSTTGVGILQASPGVINAAERQFKAVEELADAEFSSQSA